MVDQAYILNLDWMLIFQVMYEFFHGEGQGLSKEVLTTQQYKVRGRETLVPHEHEFYICVF